MAKFRLGPVRRQGFGAALFCILLVLCVLPGFAKSWAPGLASGCPNLSAAQERFPFFAVPLSRSACAGVLGGDVRLELDANGSRLKVSVIDNEYEARLNRYPPREVYEIPVHNRIVDTTDAPFMPTKASAAQTAWAEGLVSRPALFPEGLWDITAVKPRADKYGPFMVSTNARGTVDVYMKVPESVGKLYIGTFADTGYGIHSNTIPFEYSKTFGCIVARQEDLARLAKTLADDKKDDPASSQTLWVNRSKKNRDR